MKKLFIFCAFFLMASTTINAAEKIDIQSVTNGTFAAKRISGIDPLKGTDQYAPNFCRRQADCEVFI